MNPVHLAKGICRQIEAKWLDWRLGIKAGPKYTIEAKDLPTASRRKFQASSCTSAPYRSIKTLINKAIEQGYRNADFYDLGSGHGRVCFYAAKTKLFRHVTGIELCFGLVNQCQRVPVKSIRQHPYFYAGDVGSFKLPVHPAKKVLFMYHPFDGVVLNDFLKLNKPVLHTVAFAYCNDVHTQLLTLYGFKPVWEDRKWKLSFWVPNLK
jgi:hypothetical protein